MTFAKMLISAETDLSFVFSTEFICFYQFAEMDLVVVWRQTMRSSRFSSRKVRQKKSQTPYAVLCSRKKYMWKKKTEKMAQMSERSSLKTANQTKMKTATQWRTIKRIQRCERENTLECKKKNIESGDGEKTILFSEIVHMHNGMVTEMFKCLPFTNLLELVHYLE